MIPDFPEIKQCLNQRMMLDLKDKITDESPMTRNAYKKMFFEGNKMGILRENGKFEVSEMKKIQTELVLDKNEIMGLTEEQIQIKLGGLAQDMALQMSQMIFESIENAIAETGNEISCPDGLTHKWIHEALKKMTISFVDDDRNNPKLMTIYVGPDVLERFEKYEQQLTPKETERFQKEYQEILDIKYQDYLTDLNSRRLIET
ncbi:MAG: hypothetical protein Q8M15_14625 [Bacteroidota bacterium]|nr:hypothetical protein [Bacteroidota bacterium]